MGGTRGALDGTHRSAALGEKSTGVAYPFQGDPRPISSLPHSDASAPCLTQKCE